LRMALDDLVLEGVKTNIALHKAILETPEFTKGGVDTGFLGRYLAEKPSLQNEARREQT